LANDTSFFDDVDDGWATAITVVNLNSRDAKTQLIEYYANAVLSAIQCDDPTWARTLSGEISEEMDKTNDTKHKNRLRRMFDRLSGNS
jgi:hypothetical protein